jgi:NAD(P)-dependent dehydrogenase (short-subunit alcohol dehydrogenase family)
MNICVIGPGTPGHFGNDFVKRAEADGHTVYTLSHKDHKDRQHNHKVFGFSNVDRLAVVYKELVKDVDNIDLLLYNSVYGRGGAMCPEMFMENTVPCPDSDFFDNLRVNVIAPYKLSIASLKKMKEGSKIVFMTTGMSTGIDNLVPPIMATYAGAKAYQNYIMKALAEHNDKGVIVSSIAPMFHYEDVEGYKIAFERAYNHLMNIDNSHNGKIKHIGIGTYGKN